MIPARASDMPLREEGFSTQILCKAQLDLQLPGFATNEVEGTIADSGSFLNVGSGSSPSAAPRTQATAKPAPAPIKNTEALPPNRMPDDARKEKTEGADAGGADAEEKVVHTTSQRDVIGVKQLYLWSATVSMLLLLQLAFGFAQHGFRSLPPACDVCAGILLLYPLASVLAMYRVARARPFAAWVLATGSVLMTCQTAWHWQTSAAPFRIEVITTHGSTQLPPSARAWQHVYGSSAVQFLDTAMFLIAMFQSCLQSSFLSRVGIKTAATASAVQLLLLILWPLVFPNVYPAWPCRVAVPVVWAAYLIYSSYEFEAMLKRESRLMEDLEGAVRALKEGQRADSILIHILKNNMADATGCIELFCQQNPIALRELSKACDILFRGISWCKLREAMLSIVAGRYTTQCSAVDVQKFTQDLVRGRDMALECPPGVLALDPVACNIVLDNAVTNAKRHGCPVDPQVTLAVSFPTQSPSSSFDEAEGGKQVDVRFLVTNRANRDRPALQARWSSAGVDELAPLAGTRTGLSDGLGLQHIRLVADTAGMRAALWQEDATVYFELAMTTRPKRPDVASSASLRPIPVFPPGLRVFCLDDSPVARRSLKGVLEEELPDAVVATFGGSIAEVHEFTSAALTQAHIVIIDQHVDIGDKGFRGNVIVQDLLAAGYSGFACIRSGDAGEEDVALSKRSGAHYHVGKETPLRQMLSELSVEYHLFLQQQQHCRYSTVKSSELADAVSGGARPSSSGSCVPGLVRSDSVQQLAEVGTAKRDLVFPSSSTFGGSTCSFPAPFPH